jgi:hypothetical protein
VSERSKKEKDRKGERKEVENNVCLRERERERERKGGVVSEIK